MFCAAMGCACGEGLASVLIGECGANDDGGVDG
jgi:hypothetical protein